MCSACKKGAERRRQCVTCAQGFWQLICPDDVHALVRTGECRDGDIGKPCERLHHKHAVVNVTFTSQQANILQLVGGRQHPD